MLWHFFIEGTPITTECGSDEDFPLLSPVAYRPTIFWSSIKGVPLFRLIKPKPARRSGFSHKSRKHQLFSGPFVHIRDCRARRYFGLSYDRVAGDYIEALKAIIYHCWLPKSQGFTPSDFPTRLSQQQLDKLISKSAKRGCNMSSADIEDLLALSPMQQAWQQALNRHSILRTSFFWEDLEEPVQVVIEK